MIVIGAGLPRTGTLSLKSALEELIGPCYHGFIPFIEKPCHAPYWTEAVKRGTIETEGVLVDYRAGIDFPVAAFYKDFVHMFPDAKVILTVRDPRQWYTSISFMWQNTVNLFYDWPHSWVIYLKCPQLSEFARLLFGGFRAGKGEVQRGLVGKMNKALCMGEDAAIDFFNSHLKEVCDSVPADKLLVFDVREGWGPLCQFLEVQVPNKPFPNINNTNEMKMMFRNGRILSWISVLLTGLLLAYGLVFAELPSGFSMIFGIMIILFVFSLIKTPFKRQINKAKLQ